MNNKIKSTIASVRNRFSDNDIVRKLASADINEYENLVNKTEDLMKQLFDEYVRVSIPLNQLPINELRALADEAGYSHEVENFLDEFIYYHKADIASQDVCINHVTSNYEISYTIKRFQGFTPIDYELFKEQFISAYFRHRKYMEIFKLLSTNQIVDALREQLVHNQQDIERFAHDIDVFQFWLVEFRYQLKKCFTQANSLHDEIATQMLSMWNNYIQQIYQTQEE